MRCGDTHTSQPRGTPALHHIFCPRPPTGCSSLNTSKEFAHEESSPSPIILRAINAQKHNDGHHSSPCRVHILALPTSVAKCWYPGCLSPRFHLLLFCIQFINSLIFLTPTQPPSLLTPSMFILCIYASDLVVQMPLLLIAGPQ